MSPFTFNTAPSLVFGSGSIARLGEIAAQRLGPRVALVTDAGLVRAGLIAPALRALEEAGIAVDVFFGVVADPPEAGGGGGRRKGPPLWGGGGGRPRGGAPPLRGAGPGRLPRGGGGPGP